MKSAAIAIFAAIGLGGSLRAAESPSVIERVMTAADRDHDGRLSLQEYLPLDIQAKHHGKDHFEASDQNHDQQLDRTELDAALRKQTWYVILLEGVEPCFARLDADHDHKLSAAEYRGISRMPQHADQHFKNADADHDGFLNASEFAAHADAPLKKLATSSPSKVSS